MQKKLENYILVTAGKVLLHSMQITKAGVLPIGALCKKRVNLSVTTIDGTDYHNLESR